MKTKQIYTMWADAKEEAISVSYRYGGKAYIFGAVGGFFVAVVDLEEDAPHGPFLAEFIDGVEQ